VKRALTPTAQRQLVTFRVGPSELGLDVAAAHEVLRLPPILVVPGAPSFVEGVFDLRGSWIPLVDLRRRLEVPLPDDDGAARVLLVEMGGERLGLIVDRVTEVLPVPEDAIAAPAAYLEGRAAEALQGLVRLPDRPILLLDLERILTGEERLALRDIQAAVEKALQAEADAAASAVTEDAREEVEGGGRPPPEKAGPG
jgi:purine-binding chemotaxis protein CheW